jgi:hypothetical protein
MATQVVAPTQTLKALIRACLAKCRNARDAASSMAVNLVMKTDMARQIVQEAVEEGIDAELQTAYKDQRYAALRGQVTEVVKGARLRVAAAVSRISDFPLPNGTALRDSHKSEVMAAATHWMAQAETMLGRGLWLRRIAEKMPDDERTVGEVLSDKKLQALLDAARRHAAEAAK